MYIKKCYFSVCDRKGFWFIFIESKLELKIFCVIYALWQNFIDESHWVSLFLSKHIPFVSSDFGRTRRTSLVEIVKVSRDTMNYSYHGDAKLRETFLWRGESLLVYVCVCIRETCGCACVSMSREVGGVRRARSRNECGKA